MHLLFFSHRDSLAKWLWRCRWDGDSNLSFPSQLWHLHFASHWIEKQNGSLALASALLLTHHFAVRAFISSHDCTGIPNSIGDHHLLRRFSNQVHKNFIFCEDKITCSMVFQTIHVSQLFRFTYKQSTMALINAGIFVSTSDKDYYKILTNENYYNECTDWFFVLHHNRLSKSCLWAVYCVALTHIYSGFAILAAGLNF